MLDNHELTRAVLNGGLISVFLRLTSQHPDWHQIQLTSLDGSFRVFALNCPAVCVSPGVLALIVREAVLGIHTGCRVRQDDSLVTNDQSLT